MLEELYVKPSCFSISKETENNRSISSYKLMWNSFNCESSLSQKRLATETFCLVAGARRPLKFHELQAALSLENEDGKPSLRISKNKLRGEGIEFCAGFMELVDEIA